MYVHPATGVEAVRANTTKLKSWHKRGIHKPSQVSKRTTSKSSEQRIADLP